MGFFPLLEPRHLSLADEFFASRGDLFLPENVGF
jgi:hypothetical protein